MAICMTFGDSTGHGHQHGPPTAGPQITTWLSAVAWTADINMASDGSTGQSHQHGSGSGIVHEHFPYTFFVSAYLNTQSALLGFNQLTSIRKDLHSVPRERYQCADSIVVLEWLLALDVVIGMCRRFSPGWYAVSGSWSL